MSGVPTRIAGIAIPDVECDAELVYVGAMFHDVGLLECHRSAHERFEIDGANAARAFLERHDLPEERS
jgi:HD superfamily phosphodiesterase